MLPVDGYVKEIAVAHQREPVDRGEPGKRLAQRGDAGET
jgi:hypothetical protein